MRLEVGPSGLRRETLQPHPWPISDGNRDAEEVQPIPEESSAGIDVSDVAAAADFHRQVPQRTDAAFDRSEDSRREITAHLEEPGETHVARSRPCERRVAPRAPETRHITAGKRRPLRHYLSAGHFFAREAQAAKSLRERSEPWRASMQNSTMCHQEFTPSTSLQAESDREGK